MSYVLHLEIPLNDDKFKAYAEASTHVEQARATHGDGVVARVINRTGKSRKSDSAPELAASE